MFGKGIIKPQKMGHNNLYASCSRENNFKSGENILRFIPEIKRMSCSVKRRLHEKFESNKIIIIENGNEI